MIVREILLLPSFEGASIIAGKTGMDNEITGAMVLEAIDIENWGKRGQLIISSFYALEHLSESETVMFFRTMSSIGIGALVFKPERLMVEAPERIIELCDDFDLPLIKLAPQVKYESILLDVLGHILDSNLTLLNRFFDSTDQNGFGGAFWMPFAMATSADEVGVNSSVFFLFVADHHTLTTVSAVYTAF